MARTSRRIVSFARPIGAVWDQHDAQSEPADGAIGQPCHILLAHGVIVVRKPNI